MNKAWRYYFLSLILITIGINIFDSKALAGVSVGSDIYCKMRQSGIDHETSWTAAYENIKKQRTGIFKTSPKQAANMIIETVVSDSVKYDQCITFIGDLYRNKLTKPSKDKSERIRYDNEIDDTSNIDNSYDDRYSY